MNKYRVIFNYSGEINEMTTDAADSLHAILKCMPVMARKYGVNKKSMIRYFTSEKLNCEAKAIGEGKA
jgi:hypothetical protein